VIIEVNYHLSEDFSMPSYLERYQNGDCEAVWNELLALGDAVRKEPVYSDAKAVANETMQRVKRNIEKIYQRLQSLGYEFVAEKAAPSPLKGLEKQIGEDSLLGSLFGNLFSNLQTKIDLLGGSLGQSPKTRRAYNPPAAGIVEALDEYEREIGLLPLSVRAWCEIVGDVDFIGDYPKLASYHRADSGLFDIRGVMRGMMVQNPDLMTQLDKDIDLSDVNTPLPLNQFQKLMREEAKAAKDSSVPEQPKEIWWQTDPLSFDFQLDIDEAQEMIEEGMEYLEFEAEETEEKSARYSLMIAPDSLHKANISGSTYDILLPNPKADARLYCTEMTFVAYLRNSFAWGGFPMLVDYEERDEKLIAFLKEGLEAI
jgi:hypothetical protein